LNAFTVVCVYGQFDIFKTSLSNIYTEKRLEIRAAIMDFLPLFPRINGCLETPIIKLNSIMNLFSFSVPLPKFDLHYAIITAKRKTILRGSFGVEFFFQYKDENN
jgi:hypothetical protein